MSARVFPTKVDAWLWAVLLILPLTMPIVPIVAAVEGQITFAALAGGFMLVFGVVLVKRIWPIAYEVHAGELLIRVGWTRTTIPTHSVEAVIPSRNPIASPAFSLDRLAITYSGGKTIHISPADKSGFLDALVAAAPHLRRAGDKLLPQNG